MGPIGFFDDEKEKNQVISGIKVAGRLNEIPLHQDIWLVVAIGNPSVKESIIRKMDLKSQFATLIHPSVIIGDSTSVKIGLGCILAAGVKATNEIRVVL